MSLYQLERVGKLERKLERLESLFLRQIRNSDKNLHRTKGAIALTEELLELEKQLLRRHHAAGLHGSCKARGVVL